MKKFLCVSILLSVFCCGTNSYAGSNDDITNACYVTKKCGVKDSIQVMTVIPFTVAGSVLGGAGGLALGTATPWAAGPGVGFVLGGVILMMVHVWSVILIKWANILSVQMVRLLRMVLIFIDVVQKHLVIRGKSIDLCHVETVQFKTRR